MLHHLDRAWLGSGLHGESTGLRVADETTGLGVAGETAGLGVADEVIGLVLGAFLGVLGVLGLRGRSRVVQGNFLDLVDRDHPSLSISALADDNGDPFCDVDSLRIWFVFKLIVRFGGGLCAVDWLVDHDLIRLVDHFLHFARYLDLFFDHFSHGNLLGNSAHLILNGSGAGAGALCYHGHLIPTAVDSGLGGRHYSDLRGHDFISSLGNFFDLPLHIIYLGHLLAVPDGLDLLVSH